MTLVHCGQPLAGLLTSLILVLSAFRSSSQLEAPNSAPLVYTRLRLDPNYLMVYRYGYQKRYPYQEITRQVLANRSMISRLKAPESYESVLEAKEGDAPQQVRIKFYMNENKNVKNITEDELIFEAMHQVYVSQMTQMNQFYYDREEDRKRSSDKRIVSVQRCNRELDYLIEKVSQVRGLNPELAAFFDSFATEEPGLLYGNHYWTGNFKSCGRRHVFDMPTLMANGELASNPNQTEFVDPSTVSFSGRYCIVSIRSPHWSAMIDKREIEMKNYWKRPNQHIEYRNSFRLQLGVCMPESCDSVMLKPMLARIKQLALYRLRPSLYSYDLYDIYCLPDSGSELMQPDLSAWLLIVLSGVWLSAMALATFIDCQDLVETKRLREERKNKVRSVKTLAQKFVLSMSFIESWTTLATIKETKPKAPAQNDLEQQKEGPKVAQQDLIFLNAIKVVIMPSILMAHIGMFVFHSSQFTLDFWPAPNWIYHWMASSTFFVDWYFCITGILTAYAMFASRAVYKNTPFQWFYMVFHRYMRLAPYYLLTFWFARSLFKLIGSGPMWDYGTNQWGFRGTCERESWIYPLALISNFHPIHEECIVPSWYISVDFQFFLITPFLLILLSKSAKLGWLAILSMIGASLASRTARYALDPRAQPLELMHPRLDTVMRNNWDMHPTYLMPWYRVSAYLVGVLIGHYAYMVRSGQWSSPLYSDNSRQAANRRRAHALRIMLALVGFLFGGFMAGASFFTDLIMPMSMQPYARAFVAAIYTFIHVNAALGPGLFSLALLLGLWPRLRKFMEHWTWTFVSRIQFFVYLCQVEFIFYLLQVANRPWDGTQLFVWAMYALLIAMTYSAALLLTLFVANPLQRLENEFILGALMGAPRASPKSPAEGARLVAMQPVQAQGQPTSLEVDGNATPAPKRKSSRAAQSSGDQAPSINHETA